MLVAEIASVIRCSCEVFFGSAKDHGREDFNDHATGLSIQGCAIRGACSVIRLQCEEL